MNSITGVNKFCGPAVISSIAGISTDEAERMVHELRGNTRKVKSMYTTEVAEVLKRLGYRAKYLTHLSLCGSIFYLISILEDGLYLVMVPGHFILIEIDGPNRFICDNHTKKPLNVNTSARLMQKVEQVVKIEEGY